MTRFCQPRRGPASPFLFPARRVGNSVRAAFAILAVVLVVPSAWAQTPGAPQDGVTLRSDAASLEVSLDQAGSTTLTLTRTATPTGSPLDQPRSVRIVVEGAPPGWIVGVSPTPISLAPGASGKATLTIAVTAAAGDKATLRVVATMDPSNPLESTSQASIDVEAQRVESLQRSVLEENGTTILLVSLGLAAALVVALALLASQRRVALRLASDLAILELQAGRRASTVVRVANLLGGADNAYLSLVGVPEGWSAHLDQGVVGLEGREQRETRLTVSAPRDWDGAAVSIFVRAVSGRFPRRPATFEFTARPPKQP